jgi:hypothetical protein
LIIKWAVSPVADGGMRPWDRLFARFSSRGDPFYAALKLLQDAREEDSLGF